jgi:hypothetical protein
MDRLKNEESLFKMLYVCRMHGESNNVIQCNILGRKFHKIGQKMTKMEAFEAIICNSVGCI